MKFLKLSKNGKQVLNKILPHWKKAQSQTKKLLGEDLQLFQQNLKKLTL